MVVGFAEASRWLGVSFSCFRLLSLFGYCSVLCLFVVSMVCCFGFGSWILYGVIYYYH